MRLAMVILTEDGCENLECDELVVLEELDEGEH